MSRVDEAGGRENRQENGARKRCPGERQLRTRGTRACQPHWPYDPDAHDDHRRAVDAEVVLGCALRSLLLTETHRVCSRQQSPARNLGSVGPSGGQDQQGSTRSATTIGPVASDDHHRSSNAQRRSKAAIGPSDDAHLPAAQRAARPRASSVRSDFCSMPTAGHATSPLLGKSVRGGWHLRSVATQATASSFDRCSGAPFNFPRRRETTKTRESIEVELRA